MFESVPPRKEIVHPPVPIAPQIFLSISINPRAPRHFYKTFGYDSVGLGLMAEGLDELVGQQ